MKTLLVIGTNWPEPKATAAGERMQRLLALFLADDHQITFASTSKMSDLSLDLESQGIRTQAIQLNHGSFDIFIEALQPNIVLFDRFAMEEQFGWRVAKCIPQAIRILDTEDLHSLRKTRETAFKNNFEWTTAFWLQSDITKREIASIYRSDLSLIISSYEMDLLLNQIKIDASILFHLPFMLDPIHEKKGETWPSFESRKDFLCIGNGKHAPNTDAVVWLKNDIWPLIRKALPEVTLHIYGAYLPEFITQMHNPKQGFLVHGWAADIEELFQQARINLAPLRFGAGIKGKLISAMLNGTPSITTPVGAEGMHNGLDWSGTIAVNPDTIAQAAISLYHDKSKWEQAQQNGIAIVNQLHSKKLGATHFRERLINLKQHLKNHRIQNFTGALLQHQSMASTKFMSKWIALKNFSVR